MTDEAMSAIFWMVMIVAAGGLILIIGGYGKNRIFTHPERYSDAELERIMRLTGRILENTVPGTEAFRQAGAKHNAAYKEYLKRRGEDYSFLEGGQSS